MQFHCIAYFSMYTITFNCISYFSMYATPFNCIAYFSTYATPFNCIVYFSMYAIPLRCITLSNSPEFLPNPLRVFFLIIPSSSALSHLSSCYAVSDCRPNQQPSPFPLSPVISTCSVRTCAWIFVFVSAGPEPI
jgi:hypothetical protein